MMALWIGLSANVIGMAVLVFSFSSIFVVTTGAIWLWPASR